MARNAAIFSPTVQIFTVTRTDYSELGLLMLTTMVLGLVMPLAALLLVRVVRWRSA